MKIRKIEGIDKSKKLCLAEMSAIGTTILALDRAQNSTAPMLANSKGFQLRCANAIIALANTVLEDIESRYAPETKKFKVSYDVKRSGVHTMVVEARDSREARAIAERELGRMPEDEFQKLNTEFVACDVVDSEEVVDG